MPTFGVLSALVVVCLVRAWDVDSCTHSASIRSFHSVLVQDLVSLRVADVVQYYLNAFIMCKGGR